jgi:glycosyltransferase involved in cell wall biosynthesis
MIRFLYVGNHAGHFLTHRLPAMLALQKAGYEMHVAVPDQPDDLEQLITVNAVETITQLGFIVHPIPITRGSLGLINAFRSLVVLYRLYRQLKPDLIYHATIKPVIYGGLISRLIQAPKVLNAMTGLGYAFTNKDIKARIIKTAFTLAYRFIMGHPGAVAVFQNEDDRASFVDAKLVDYNRTAIIRGSGVDMEKFSPASDRRNGPPVIMLASRMLWDKGVGEFVESAKASQQAGLQARFVLVGDSDPENPAAITRQQLQTWHESRVVEWWGWRNDMVLMLRQADIFCLPSYREGLSKAMIEAAAMGLPIVTADVPGCREIVHHGENGFLVPVRDSAALFDTLRQLVSDPVLRAQMGAASREIAVHNYSVEAVCSTTVELCSKLLNG